MRACVHVCVVVVEVVVVGRPAERRTEAVISRYFPAMPSSPPSKPNCKNTKKNKCMCVCVRGQKTTAVCVRLFLSLSLSVQEGGVEVVIEESPFPRVRALRCNMGEETVVKEMVCQTLFFFSLFSH
jgi:hypothetical protein